MTDVRPRLEIVVDELVVRGLTPEQACVAAASLETRLGVLAEESDAAVPDRAEAFRRVPEIGVPAASPAALGEAVAAAVWGAVAQADPDSGEGGER
jgi:hypothetical protein